MSGGRFSVNATTPGYQATPSVAATTNKKTDYTDLASIGLQATDQAVTTNRRCNIVQWIVIVAMAAVLVATAIYALGYDRPVQVKEDSLQNNLEARNVEIFLQNDDPGDGGIVCSGVFIRQTGEILTAAHCFYTSNPESCDFTITPYPHYPTTIDTLSVEIMAVNGTREKYTFTAQIVAWSGLTDVAIIKVGWCLFISLPPSPHLLVRYQAAAADQERWLSHHRQQSEPL
jgi:hypothetical protein